MDRQKPRYDNERAQEAVTAFRGFANWVGLDFMNGVILVAENQIAEGKEGITMPSDDRSVNIVVNKDGVSFKAQGDGPYIVTLDEAKTILEDLRERDLQNPPSAT